MNGTSISKKRCAQNIIFSFSKLRAHSSSCQSNAAVEYVSENLKTKKDYRLISCMYYYYRKDWEIIDLPND